MSLSQLAQLLPLPQEELRQILDYAATLSKAEAASHFSNLLGDSPLAVDFISSFNARRHADPSPVKSDAVEPVPKRKQPAGRKKQQQQQTAIHTPQARRVGDYAGPAGKAYNKKDSELEYIPQQRDSAPGTAAGSRHASRPSTPPRQEPGQPKPQPQPKPKPKQPVTTAGGYLISDMPKKGKEKPAPKPAPSSSGGVTTTKVSISGGVPMAGQSTALADLDLAIRSLEMSTNPTLDQGRTSRRCNCVATRHPLLAAAPNCLSCGKVVCLKEGLGPCTFCGAPILSSGDLQAMLRELKDERGREKMAANNNTAAAAQAREHRDKLLGFQANNAKRTTVHDEAADFDVSGAAGGAGSMWATPEERARELKRQQKLLREMEWNARPEYEKRQQIVSIDLAGRRVIKTIASAQRPATPDEGEEEEEEEEENEEEEPSYGHEADRSTLGGTFSANPLLGAATRPVYRRGEDGTGRRERRKGWRRVQDDLDDNEGIILDGGALGHAAGGDEPER